MSKSADCPKCGEHNCVSDKIDLNYCMYCGYSFKAKRESKPIIVDYESGQISFFNTGDYKAQQAWNGG